MLHRNSSKDYSRYVISMDQLSLLTKYKQVEEEQDIIGRVTVTLFIIINFFSLIRAHESWGLPTPPHLVTFAKKLQSGGLYAIDGMLPTEVSACIF